MTEIIRGKPKVEEAGWHLTIAEIEEWVDEVRKGLENALRAKPLKVRAQFRQVKEMQEPYGETMLELRTGKIASLLDEDVK